MNAVHDLRSELLEIVRSRSLRLGLFTLSSGKQSSLLYFNMKPTMMAPRGAQLAAQAFLDIVADVGAEYVGGLEMGTVPVIGSMAALSSAQRSPVSTVFVRKQPKPYGTRDVIEGLGPDETILHKKVLIVDDVATSGRSILKAINEVRAVGGIVEHAACLVNREEGAQELLAGHGVRLHSVLFAHEFLAAR